MKPTPLHRRWNSGESVLSALVGVALILVMIVAVFQMTGSYLAVVREAKIHMAILEMRQAMAEQTNCARTIPPVPAVLAACRNAIKNPIEIFGYNYKTNLPLVDNETTPTRFGNVAAGHVPGYKFDIRATCHSGIDAYRLFFEFRMFGANNQPVFSMLMDELNPGTRKDLSQWTPLYSASSGDGLPCEVRADQAGDFGGIWETSLPAGTICSNYCASLVPPRVNAPDSQGYMCLNNTTGQSSSSSPSPPLDDTNLHIGTAPYTDGGITGYCRTHTQDQLVDPARRTTGCYCI